MWAFLVRLKATMRFSWRLSTLVSWGTDTIRPLAPWWGVHILRKLCATQALVPSVIVITSKTLFPQFYCYSVCFHFWIVPEVLLCFNFLFFLQFQTDSSQRTKEVLDFKGISFPKQYSLSNKWLMIFFPSKYLLTLESYYRLCLRVPMCLNDFMSSRELI